MKVEPLGVAGEQLVEPRLVDRGLTAPQRLDLLGDDVAGEDGVAELGEAGGRDQADPADPDHPYRLILRRHRPPFLFFGFGLGTITSAERAMPSIWSLVSVLSRSLAIQ